MARLALLLGQIGLLAVLYRYYPTAVRDWLTRESGDLGGLVQTPIPHLALALFVAATLVSLAVTIRSRSLTEACYLGVTVAAVLTCHYAGNPVGPAVFTGLAGVLLIVPLVETSYTLAYRDMLTGLPSRRALDERLSALGRRYALAMVDIDHFKEFNDRYGHALGDDALRFVAARIRDVGGGGAAYRYGGEEFVIVFAGKTLDEALPHVNALRTVIANAPLVLRERQRSHPRPRQRAKRGTADDRTLKFTRLTVSIGVAERDTANLDTEDVLRAADQALYRAKARGRNRVSA
jgi:diguanylate cyclase (GGDEF)-like protein